MRGLGGAALTLALAVAGEAAAQSPAGRPQMSQQEALQLVTAAGFTMRGPQVANSCGKPTQPGFAFTDLNGDGRPEAIIGDLDAACYPVNGARSHVLRKEPDGQWRLVGIAAGKIVLLAHRTNGWRNYTVEGQGCQRTWTWDTGRDEYLSLQPCPGETGYRPPGAPPPEPPKTTIGGTPADRAAAFKAAGVTPTRGKYLACNSTDREQQIEFKDLNGDRRPDAVITDFGSYCYGHTEQGYTIVTKEANGAWTLLVQNQGIPDFQTTRGVGGWPDIVNGGPGFCFPVMRWNGSDYVRIRWKADPAEPRACAGR